MNLEPVFWDEAKKQLDELEVHEDERLWNAVVDTLEMICRDDQDGTGRAHPVHGSSGTHAWAARVPYGDDLWIVWEQRMDTGVLEAHFLYVGPLNGIVRE
jgi:hypothetical protein